MPSPRISPMPSHLARKLITEFFDWPCVRVASRHFFADYNDVFADRGRDGLFEDPRYRNNAPIVQPHCRGFQAIGFQHAVLEPPRRNAEEIEMRGEPDGEARGAAFEGEFVHGVAPEVTELPVHA